MDELCALNRTHKAKQHTRRAVHNVGDGFTTNNFLYNRQSR